MGNNQMLPFERNRYYVGKLLTSADFQAEQNYGIQKRCFLNGLMFGSGIVCGLGVFSLDDLSIMVDSGVALDGNGREIAVDSAVVRKLSAVEGFETLESQCATLCLRYDEEAVHPVYTVHGQESGEDYECNRTREGWKLFLQDSDRVEKPEPPETEFFSSAQLYADEDYAVTCTIPGQTPCGAVVRMDITVSRLNEDAAPLTLEAVLQLPAFTDETGSHELKVELSEVCPDGEFTVSRSLKAQSAPAGESVILADGKDIRVRVGEQERSREENFLLRAAVVEATAVQIVDQAVTAASLEMRGFSAGRDCVPLAEIVLQRTRNAYLIEEIRTVGVRRYIRTAADTVLREELEGWFRPRSTVAGAAAVQPGQSAVQRYVEPVYATGLCELPLSPGMRRGQVAFSDEIIHGLGPGNVYVEVGTEFLSEDVKVGAPARNTIYGNASLFAHDRQHTVPVETAVKVMNDRGSFVVAAKLLEDSSQVILPLRWVAISLPGGGEESKLEKMAGKSISAVQPTVVMGTRESRFINIQFKNMEPCTLNYELTEKNAGEITSDGVYTAPGREGVFEIRVSCAEMPLISTYAYVVVRKRDADEMTE